MAVRFSLKSRIVAAMMVGSIIGLSAIIGIWLTNEQQNEVRTTRNQVTTKQQLVEDALSGQLNSLSTITDSIAHSLALRRIIIAINQQIMAKSNDQRQQYLEHKISDLKNRARQIEVADEITDSLEADYLRSIIRSSNGVIERITVTDAFGFVQIASHLPDEYYLFYHDWWQSTLRFGHIQTYHYSSFDEERGEYLYLNRPVFNDEGTDPVGIVQVRINLRVFFTTQSQTLQTGSAQSIVVTNKNQIHPATFKNGPFTIGEILTFSQKRSDLFLSEKHNCLLRIDPFSDMQNKFMPGLNWSLITYQEAPTVFSISHPTFRKTIFLWFSGVIILLLLCYLISIWVDAPIQSIATALNQIVSGNYRIRLPDDSQGGGTELSKIVNQLAETLEESTLGAHRSLRESSSAISAFEDFTQEAALEHDRRVIADSLLRLSIRRVRADAGILIVHNHDYQTPMTLKYNLSEAQLDRYTAITLHGVHSKKLFFSWDNPEFQPIWDDGFQVLMATPVRTRHTKYGTLYLLFDKAISKALEKDRTVELLALQAAVYSSRSGLFHQLNRQISFNEGILSGIPWFICTLNSSFQITWHNNQLSSIGMAQESDVLNSLCCHTFKKRTNRCPDCPAQKTLSDGKSHSITQRWINSDDQTQWMRVSSFPFMDKTGKMQSVILFIQNITSETRTQSELKQLSHALESIGEAVALTEMNGKIAFINKAFLDIFGYTESEVSNRSLDILFSIDQSEVYDQIRTSIGKDAVWNRQIELIKKSQESFPVHVTASLVRDDAGVPIGQVVTFFDLSNQLDREKQLMHQYKELEILHKISSILTEGQLLRDMLQTVLEQLIAFSKCHSGVVLLFDVTGNEVQSGGKLSADRKKPAIYAETNLPGFFVKYTSEIRQGQEFELYSQLCQSEHPVILNHLNEHGSVDARLLNRMGVQSLQAIPLTAANQPIGLIMLFSELPYHFHATRRKVMKAIAEQTAQTIFGRYLQQRLVKDTGLITTSHLLNQIGGDVIRLGASLEQSRQAVDASIADSSIMTVSENWMGTSRLIWHLQQVALSIPLLGADDQRLFFPENLNIIIQKLLAQIGTHHFASRLNLTFVPCSNMQEVYINKQVINQCVTNLLALLIETVWESSALDICISIKDTVGPHNFYSIDFGYDRNAASDLEPGIEDLINHGVTVETPVLLASISKGITVHSGKLVLPRRSDSRGIIRFLLAKHPDRL